LANPTSNGCLRLYFTPFVTPHTGQSIRVKCGDGKELTRSYSAGPRREAMLDLPLSGVKSNGDIPISITIDAPNSPASVGLGADERRLGIQLHRLEFVTSFSRVTSTTRWALSPFFGPVRRLLSKPRNFLIRPLIERLGQVENQIREHGDTLRAMTSEGLLTQRLNVLEADLVRLSDEGLAKQGARFNALQTELVRVTNEGLAKQGARFNALQTELVRVTNEGLAKQGAQVDAVLRAIENLPSRFVSLEQALVRLEQLIVSLHEKTDIVANRVLLPVDDDTVLVRCLVGYLYCSRNDHAVLVGLTESGEFEPGLRRLLERVLEPGMNFLDVGAHLGLYTLAAARRVGKTGRVFCFEPTPVTYQLLCRTLRLNGLEGRVTARCAAAGREDTTKPLHVSTISSH